MTDWHVLRTAEDLKASPYNPRTVTPEALQALGASLHEFGDISSITWNQRTGNLVCGHQRMTVLRQRHGDALRIEDGVLVTPTGERFPIRIVDWPLFREQAANIAANSPHLAGVFDDSKLAAVLADLATNKEIEALIGDLRLDELLATAPSLDVFEPQSVDGTPRLDKRNPPEPVTCPQCGNRFTPGDKQDDQAPS